MKNHRHEAGVFLLEEFDRRSNEKWIVKSSSDISGICDIRRELSGIDWYNIHSNNFLKYELAVNNSRYINVKHDLIDGVVPNFERKTYRSNLKYINSVIIHYCEVWGDMTGSRLAPMHGDLSLLGNIIFIEDHFPVIIDWEHFTTDGAPIGFDALYFLFELLWYELLISVDIHQSVLSHIAEMMELLKMHGCLSEYYFYSPLSAVNDYMIENKQYWGAQFTKMPNLLYSNHHIEIIDEFLSL